MTTASDIQNGQIGGGDGVPGSDLPKAAVLLVKDNEPARVILRFFLEQAGYEAFEAASADEAMQWLGLRSDFQALLTDIEMPGSMDGLALAANVRQLFPQMAILVSSGGIYPGPDDLPHGAVFMGKPLSSDTLLEQVLRLLFPGQSTIS